MSFTHWKKLDNPDYIGAYAFEPGEEKTVTIRSVSREMVVGADGKREECTVVHFDEAKPMILNTTNAKMISKHAGTPYIERWAGVRIVLAVERVKAFGDMVDAVRVSKKKAAPAQTYTCADCGETIADAKLAEYGKTKFGVCVCVKCGQARAKKEDA